MGSHVDGIVHGAATAQPGGWYVMFLMPWRHPDGHVVDEALRVAPDVSHRVAQAAARRYIAGAAVRVSAKRFTKGRGFTYWNADGITQVRALRRLELPRPAEVTLAHPLGPLVLDGDRGGYVGTRGRVELVIDRVDGLLDRATARVRAAEDQQPAIRAAIGKRLLPLYNTTWRERGPALDVDEFERRLKLTAIHVGDDRTTLYYASGSLFSDHGVEVRLGPRGAIAEVLIS